jgi:hypothetical protein
MISEDVKLLLQLIEQYGVKHLFKHLKYKQKGLFEKITNATFRFKDATFSERIYAFIYNLQERPGCLNCKLPVKYKGFSTGYAMYCGHACVARHTLTKTRKSEVLLKNHNVNCPVKVRWNKKEK